MQATTQGCVPGALAKQQESALNKPDLDALHALTEENIRLLLPPKIYARAEYYYHDQRVRNPRRVGSVLEAQVQGTKLYNVRIAVENGTLSLECNCPYATTGTCKHIGAVLLQWVHEPETFISEDAGPSVIEGKAQRVSSAQVNRASPLNNPPWWYKRLAATSSTTASSSETELSLHSLLEGLQLYQLQDIARQRGWQVIGNSKADYVAALASLLTDPTEVARAVTALPDNLREALRAATVAEDGGGITPSTLALTMSALRGETQAPIKPVQAAGLLLDLARWGLLIPWRDSEDSPLRYLLLWEVQRHMPPLPGWCCQSPQAPSAQVLSRSGQQLVQLLRTVWEHISQHPPALRPRPQSLPKDHPLIALQSWRYNSEEAKKWLSSSRRRAEVASSTLTVLSPTFLLDDPALSTLAPLTDNNLEQLEFICRLLCNMDLVSIEQGHLTARPEVMARFLRISPAEQHAIVAQAYISLSDWSELDMLLRTDSRLILRHNMHSPFRYDQFRSQLTRLRHILLRFLASAGEEGWCMLTSVESALRTLWPDFPNILGAQNQQWYTKAWWLAWRKDQRELEPDNLQDWRAAQGGFLHTMLTGPLHWLGLAELCITAGELVAFRLRGLSDLVWDRPVVMTEDHPGKIVAIDEEALAITVHPSAISPHAHTLLGRIAILDKSAPGRFIYKLDMRTASKTFTRGETLPELLATWKRLMPVPLPNAMRKVLDTWWASYGQVRLYEGLALLQLNDDLALRELEASTSLGQHIIARLSPRLVLVPDEAVDTLLREFTDKGYMPMEAND